MFAAWARPRPWMFKSIVERIEKALAEHDLDAAYQEWKELPGAAADDIAKLG